MGNPNPHRRARSPAAELAGVIERLSRIAASSADGGALREEIAELRALTADVDDLAYDDELLGRAEEELEATRDRLLTVIGAMPIVLWAVDAQGLVVLSEGQALASLGLRAGELVGSSVFDVYAGSPDALEAIRHGLEGRPHASEVEVGGRSWSNRYYPRTAADGSIVGLTGLSIDVTESKRMRDEALHLEAQVRHAQKLESLGVLAGGIAHDFNNLLAVILGNVEVALRKLEPDAPARSKLLAAERAAVRAAELTHQLLVYAGRSRVKIETVDLNELVRELASLLGTAISKSARIEYALDADLPSLDADSAQLRQVVMNLIMNASDALEGRPGRIKLATGVVAQDAGDREASSPLVVLEVRDDGIGMDEATLARIFDPFFTTKFTGRGLGLAAVSGIIRSHGGKLEVTSQPGEGTCFRVTLPSALGAVVRRPLADLPTEHVAHVATGETILLVDDDDEVRQWMREVLEEAGYRVVEAACGEDALVRASSSATPIAAAVIDVVMPGMSGHALRALLHDRDPNVPVVMISAFEHEDATAAEDRQIGVTFVAKPFTTCMLLAVLRGVLRGTMPSPAIAEP